MPTALGDDAVRSVRDKQWSAGVCVMWRSHLEVRPLDLAEVATEVSPAMLSRLCGCFIRLKALTVLALELYLFTGENLSGRNQEILLFASRVAHLYSTPALVFGDFQTPAQELVSSEWAFASRLSFVPPVGSSLESPLPTCFAHPPRDMKRG